MPLLAAGRRNIAAVELVRKPQGRMGGLANCTKRFTNRAPPT
ncbi:hypothetical protein [Paracoccus siganidrum]|nr:hypothetical protein [Paracoccus siganidrum]